MAPSRVKQAGTLAELSSDVSMNDTYGSNNPGNVEQEDSSALVRKPLLIFTLRSPLNIEIPLADHHTHRMTKKRPITQILTRTLIQLPAASQETVPPMDENDDPRRGSFVRASSVKSMIS